MVNSPKLNIGYNQSQQHAVVTAKSLESWRHIRRLCLDRSDDAFSVSNQQISMPWTSFLGIRRELFSILSAQSELDFVTFSKPAEELLLSAASQFDQYTTPTANISKDSLRRALVEKGFLRKLTPEQIRNVSHLIKRGGGATFSVPGAGKTTEALAYFFYHKQPTDKLLVVAPKNAFSAWEEQLSLCAPESLLTVERLRGPRKVIRKILSQNPDVVLINYQKLQNDKNLIAAYLASNQCFMFLDESHHIKKWPPGPWGACVLSLAHLPIRRLILTGTPLPNSTLDLMPQFSFLYPEVSVNEDDVVEKIKPIFVRTTKPELKLKDPIVSVVRMEMSESQRCLYDLLRRSEAKTARKFLKTRDRNQLRSLGRSAMRMLQLTSNPALLVKSAFYFPDELRSLLLEDDSPKIEFACNKALQLATEGKKCVIWSSFVENVETISMRLGSIGADYIHGGVDAGSEEESDTREGKIKRFHDDSEAYVLVANPAACAEGISLHTVCHHAIYVDRTYNAAQFIQSQDRIHRLGLPKNISTHIQILSCIDSVDDSVESRLKMKLNVMAKVLNDDSLCKEVIVENLDETGSMTDEDVADYLQHLIGEK